MQRSRSLASRARTFNPMNERRLQQLDDSIVYSKKQQKFYKETRMMGLRQYVGRHYSESGSERDVPLNMINMMVDTYQRNMVSDEPMISCTTPHDEFASMADDMELAINYVLARNGAQVQYARAAVDMMFGGVMMKVGLNRTDRGAGFPFAKLVPSEDAFHDCVARDDEEIFYIGNDYRVPLEWARENKNFGRKGRSELQRSDYFEFAWEDGDVSPNVFSRGESAWGVEEFEPMVALRDVFMPHIGKSGVIATVSRLRPEIPLEVYEWEGPRHPLGCYYRAGVGYVPGNILPLAPIHMVLDLHNLLNAIFAKTGDQALAQKTILGVPLSDLADGDAIVQAYDGQAIPMSNPGAAKEYKFGGASPEGTAMLLYLRDMFSYACGNLDLMAGTDVSSPTATQDRLLAASSSQKLVQMQKSMAKLQKEVARAIGWYLYNDPTLKLPLKKKLGDTGIEIPFWLTPARFTGDFYNLSFDMDPYTLASRSPQEKLQMLLPLVKDMLPIMAAAQMVPDGEWIAKLVSKYSHMPEYKRLWKYGQGQQIQEPPPVGETETHNFRHNVPTATRKGKERVMAASLMGARQQGSETKKMFQMANG